MGREFVRDDNPDVELMVVTQGTNVWRTLSRTSQSLLANLQYSCRCVSGAGYGYRRLQVFMLIRSIGARLVLGKEVWPKLAGR